MPVNINQAFLHKAEERRLQLGRQALLAPQVQLNGDATSLSEAVHVPAKGRAETQFVQQGGMQEIRNGAQFVGDQSRVFDGGRQAARHLGIPYAHFALDARKLEFQRGQRLSSAVVQVAGNAAPFVILHAQQPSRQTAQIAIALLELRGTLTHAELELRPRSQQHVMRASEPQVISAARLAKLQVSLEGVHQPAARKQLEAIAQKKQQLADDASFRCRSQRAVASEEKRVCGKSSQNGGESRRPGAAIPCGKDGRRGNAHPVHRSAEDRLEDRSQR